MNKILRRDVHVTHLALACNYQLGKRWACIKFTSLEYYVNSHNKKKDVSIREYNITTAATKRKKDKRKRKIGKRGSEYEKLVNVGVYYHTSIQ